MTAREGLNTQHFWSLQLRHQSQYIPVVPAVLTQALEGGAGSC